MNNFLKFYKTLSLKHRTSYFILQGEANYGVWTQGLPNAIVVRGRPWVRGCSDALTFLRH